LTEIRSIRESEADCFLELLCSVFNLDPVRARSVFFTEPLFDLRRKWALFKGGEMVSVLTTTPLEFGWGRAFGIAGVATRFERRGEGLASQLLGWVFDACSAAGEGAGLLFAKDRSLYERNGFRVLDEEIRGPVVLVPEEILPPILETDDVRSQYDAWAQVHPDRLRRDETRWRYWSWHYRVCNPFMDGYLCAEPGVIREAIYGTRVPGLPLSYGTEWFGTRTMTELLRVPLAGEAKGELFLMGRNVPSTPQMFMTDQF
jgi:GNAT superfamily N-acetyltransferase